MSAEPPRSTPVVLNRASDLARPATRPQSAGDSLHTNKEKSSQRSGQRQYVTRARVEAIQRRLNVRQRSVLVDVGRLGVVTGRQLQRLHYGESAAAGRLARKHIGQLRHWGVLSRLGRLGKLGPSGSNSYVYGPGLVGQRLLDPNRSRYFPRWTPRSNFLRHAVAVSELYVQLRQAERDGATELLAYDTEPKCWRRYFGPGGARSVLKPDSMAVIGLDELEYRYFVEIDCSTEHRPQIVGKAKAYVRYWQSGREQADTGIFPLVLWVAPDTERSDFLVDCLSALPAEHWCLFTVSTAEEVAKRIAAGRVSPINEAKEVR